MPRLTALLHTFNDAPILGRALETLYPCDEILIVDRGSRDATLHIAHEYGARVIPLSANALPSFYLQSAGFDWILCLEPRESLTEALAASLYEWKSVETVESVSPLNLFLREETPQGWADLPLPQTRLVPKAWTRWQEWLPAPEPSAKTLAGPLLRFMLTRP